MTDTQRLTPASIILLTYNTLDLTIESLGRLADDAIASGWQFIVVDNASSDQTASMVATRFPQVELLTAPQNRGFAAGNNLGIRKAYGEFVILLNSDVVVELDTLASLAGYLRQNPTVGAVSPALLTAKGEPQAYAFGDEPTMWTLLKRNLLRAFRSHDHSRWEVSKPLDVDWISAACICIRREVIEEVGLLDERYFLYFEDVEWCRRMRAAGWRIVYYPKISVVHLGGASQIQSNTFNQHYVQSLRTYYACHYSWPSRLLLSLLLPMYKQIRRQRSP